MRKYIYSLLQNSGTVTTEQMLIQTGVAIAVGLIIYLSYWITHTGTVYSKKFNVSLIVLTILTSVVMAVIGSNVAMSLGMVGALSIVRYRTAIKDSRDTVYIFWAIIAGICCGAGDYMIVAVGSCAVFFVFLLLGRIRNDNRLLLIVRGVRDDERAVEAFIYNNFGRQAILRVKNTSSDSIELIYEISKKSYEKVNSGNKTLVERIYALGALQYVNIVAQNDEVV